MRKARHVAAVTLILLLVACGFCFAQAQQGKTARIFPGKQWERIEKPESIGYSSARLNALRAWLESIDTTAMMVSVGGRSLFEYGDLSHLSYLASVRKSLLAILYGKYVENGTIDLRRTLREIGLTDHGGLLEIEQGATIENLITARSGVYHEASNAGDSLGSAPPRGSQRPGAYYLYSNWDFNAVGATFEKLTGRDIYDALQADLAEPVGMQDFDRARHKKSGDLKKSAFPAYHMWLSTRDMARVGLLMLRQGEWDGKQVASREWVRRITSLVTPLHDMNPPSLRALGRSSRWGYGYMWWVWDAPGSSGPFAGAFTGMGAGGQFITVLPSLDMVIAHKTDTSQPSPHAHEKRGRALSADEYHAILHLLIAARCSGPC
jgi:CubicO group peptidase (beta-lactamase class C family)